MQNPIFYVRPARQEDLAGISEMIIATDLAESGESDFTQAELEAEWQKPRFDPTQDAWVALAPIPGSGVEQVIGYEEVWDRAGHARLDGDGYVHPDFLNQGVGSALLRQAAERARQHAALAEPGVQVSLRNGLYGSDQRARQLHEQEGYSLLRYFWRMRIELASPPPPPQWPEGLRLRTMQIGTDDQAVYAANTEAFADHWEYLAPSFADWQQRVTVGEDVDASLYFLAEAGDQLAGFALCRVRSEGGWVSTLGVRRPWRRQGLGQALLQHSFGEFYRRGQRRVELGVDAASLTGAARLYEKAGMRIAHEFVVYEKVIRPGRALVIAK